jgi:tetratricopeptide (TPR) repeat protein
MIAEGVDVAARVFGPQHERTRVNSIYLARADLNAGHVAEAVALLEQLREEAINSLGPESAQVMAIEFRLSTALTRAGNLDRAIEMLDRVLRHGAMVNDTESVRQPAYRVRLANLLLDRGRTAEAAAALDVAAVECPAGATGDGVRATIAKARERLAAMSSK